MPQFCKRNFNQNKMKTLIYFSVIFLRDNITPYLPRSEELFF
uniref:Uncharacterized protein n=1 Tax=Elizabethkingia anophelis TaxID=1117645 RepID=A0A455ZI62_9FLAO|nr:TPA_exp: hypothetical protein [Elizabethkingia anophelis]DAC76000.1 TPA_exp: hypothetical protein [Elizabethkingia anophelis]DAC76547.1 TPA_exp: hypothetical protein [Elizabethkingia anophelis]